MPPKKHAKHHDDKHDEEKDLRRAFEHMSRVHLLRPAVDSVRATQIDGLVETAKQQLAQSHNKPAADLLRAAEHLSFASLQGEHAYQPKLSKGLIQTIRAQFDHLKAKSAEHLKPDSPFGDLYQVISKQADLAYQNGDYHRALEFQRAAEALTHVKLHGPHALPGGPAQRRLAAS